MNGGQELLPSRQGVPSHHRPVYIRLSSQKLPSQYFQSYSKVWNSFSKWARSQIEQDRIILASDFSKFNFMQFSSHPTSSPKTTPKNRLSALLKNFSSKTAWKWKIKWTFPTPQSNSTSVLSQNWLTLKSKPLRLSSTTYLNNSKKSLRRIPKIC